jgi:CPA2 family monovalent cation:H+ antiporter-2
MHSAPEFLQSLAVVFCVAGVTTVVFQKLRQPVVFGYLVAGMIVGPHIPIPLVADPGIVQSLSELGMILLMFFLGLEFSLTKLIRVGPTAGVVALVQSSFMIWLGYHAGLLFGWPPLESFYAGAVLAISSTTIIVAAFMEQGIKGKFTEIVFGVLIVEDLIGILLMAILTTASSGTDVSARELALTAGRLAAFLAGLLVVGMLTVPRLVRAVYRLKRPETTLVSTVAICFGCALLARAFGYSVALGAFIGGALVAESGLQKPVERIVKPLCDAFAAVFFVSVGMLIDPGLVVRHWIPVAVFLFLVIAGKVAGVTLGSFLAGYGVRTSVQAGMSLAQIGEFSFIIAALGLSTGATREFLYPVAVTVSAATTLLTPWMIRWSGPAADGIDRWLPKPIRTFAALYDSWLERMRHGMEPAQATRGRRLRFLLLLIDFALMLGILSSASAWRTEISGWIAEVTGLSAEVARYALLAAVVLVSAVFCYAIARGARRLVLSLVDKAMPKAEPGKLDLAAAPRRAMIVTLQTGIVIVVGLPLLAFFQPFLPGLPVAVIFLGVMTLLGISFWRGTANLEGHVKAFTQVIVESLRKQTEAKGAEEDDKTLHRVRKLFPGLGHIAPLRVGAGSYCAGKTMGGLNVGSLTGATILVILRGEGNSILPTGKDILQEGDVLTLAGTPEAVEAARKILSEGPDGANPAQERARGASASGAEPGDRALSSSRSKRSRDRRNRPG